MDPTIYIWDGYYMRIMYQPEKRTINITNMRETTFRVNK